MRSLAVLGSRSGDTAGGVLEGVCKEILVVSGLMRVQFGVGGRHLCVWCVEHEEKCGRGCGV